MELSGASKADQEAQAELLEKLERKKRMRTMVVPTDDYDVKMALRSLEEPICAS
jgi:U4/U6 small nuclear ribonucleoprotein PRP4